MERNCAIVDDEKGPVRGRLMPRYVNADRMISELRRTDGISCEELKWRKAFEHCIEIQSTEAVVPLEEYERVNNILRSYIVRYGKKEEKRASEKKIKEKCCLEIVEHIKVFFVNVMENGGFFNISDLIYELKEKYTEDKK